MDGEVSHLLGVDRDRLARRLRSTQPGPEHRVNWWLGLIETATFHATYPPPADRRACLTLVVDLLDAAHTDGVLSADDRTIQLTNLAAAALTVSDGTLVDALRPATAAHRCLDAITATGLTPQEAARLMTGWRDLPTGHHSRLRLINNLLSPLQVLREHLPPGDLADAVDRWLSIRPPAS